MKIFLAAVLIDALRAPLEDRKVAFDHVGVDLATAILASRVIDEGVHELLVEVTIEASSVMTFASLARFRE